MFLNENIIIHSRNENDEENDYLIFIRIIKNFALG